MSAIERPVPALNTDERTTLESWLEFHRTTLAMKCDGLNDEQAAVASVPPSGFTLIGLVQHMAEVERNVHMIEEYARHNGHADLVRERIDGSTGV